MPAALAITPLSGVAAVKTTSEPAAPVSPDGSGAEGFGQVLRSVWAAAPGGAPAAVPGNVPQHQPAPVDPEAVVAAIEETAAVQVAVTVPAPLAKVVPSHTAVPAGKPSHLGKADHRTDVAEATDPGASTANPIVAPVSVGMAAPVVDPALGVVPVAPVPADPVPVSMSGDPLVPVRIAPTVSGSGGDGVRAQGGVPDRPVNGSEDKQKTSTETAAAPVATPPQAQVNTVDVLTAAATTDSVAANGTTQSPPDSQIADSGGQAGSASADPKALPQGAPAAGSDVPGDLSVSPPAQRDGPLALAAAQGGSSAASGDDHKVTLRPVAAGADPKTAAPSDSTQQPIIPVSTQVTTPVATPPTAAVAAPHSASPASPVEQLAPALLTLAKTADGGQQMTVRLHPAELGMVQVRIAQAASGTTQVEITADNPATLLALQRDQPQLHRTLDDAGIAAAGRTVTFHIAQPAAAATGGGATSSDGQGTSQQGSGGRTGAGSTEADASAGDGRGSYAARERTAYPAGRRSGVSAAPVGVATGAAATVYRIGLDITA